MGPCGTIEASSLAAFGLTEEMCASTRVGPCGNIAPEALEQMGLTEDGCESMRDDNCLTLDHGCPKTCPGNTECLMIPTGGSSYDIVCGMREQYNDISVVHVICDEEIALGGE